MHKQTITVDGIEYTRTPPPEDMPYVIIRSARAGVFVGRLHSRNGQEVQMRDARRIWYWSGALTLSHMAMDGVSNPQACKFAPPLPTITVLEVIEVVPCSDAARKNLEAVPAWQK